jgi:hypothetical protein
MCASTGVHASTGDIGASTGNTGTWTVDVGASTDGDATVMVASWCFLVLLVLRPSISAL